MFTTFILLASALPGDGPTPIRADTREARLAELLEGSWFGSWTREGQRDGGAYCRKGVLMLPMAPPAQVPPSAERRAWLVSRDDWRAAHCWDLEIRKRIPPTVLE
jgi:hypothetical protein